MNVRAKARLLTRQKLRLPDVPPRNREERRELKVYNVPSIRQLKKVIE